MRTDRLLRTCLLAASILAAWLAMGGSASAATCTSQATGNWNSTGTWTCNEVPDSGDTVSVISPHTVTVTAPHTAGSLSIAGGATLTANSTLGVTGGMTVTGGTLGGSSAVAVAGAFTKNGPGLFTVQNSVDLNLNGDSSHNEGSICPSEFAGGGNDPNININQDYTIASAVNGAFSGCSTSVARVHVNAPDGHIISQDSTTNDSGIENDGTITSQAGTFVFRTDSGGNLVTHDGDFLASSGATLEFIGASAPLGSNARLGGAGTIHQNALGLQLAAGATVDPATLRVSGVLGIDGSTPLTLPSVNLTGGTLDSDRPLTLNSFSITSGTLAGSGGVTVPSGASFSKTTAGTLHIQSGSLVLNRDVTWNAGAISLSNGGGAGDPQLHINKTFTLADGASASPFSASCNACVKVNAPDGHLVKTAAATMTSNTGIENDDTLTVSAGELILGGGLAGATSDGQYIASSGATLEFLNVHQVGPTGRVGGAGTIDANTLALTLASGAVLDPAVLNLLFGSLILDGSSQVTLPVVNQTGGALNTDRPVTVTSYAVTVGTLMGNGSVTVPDGGSFSKTGDGGLTITNDGGQGSADLILNEDATFAGGSMCVSRNGDQDPDLPGLHINANFTIGGGTSANAFPCGGVVPTVHVNTGGHLTRTGAGTTTSQVAWDVAGGTVTVASGQTFNLQNGLLLNSGVLRGDGQVTGNVTNSGGTVRPGTSPGNLTIQGNYTQNGGTLETEIVNAGSFDHLQVNGTATLGGTLAIQNQGGFTPAASDEFEILTASTRSGTFSTITGEQFSGGHYVANYNPGDVTLSVASDPAENTAPPSISGDATEDQTLTCNPGTWTGSPSFEFQWLRDGAPISGATASTYTLTAADVGKQIGCRVTGANGAGSDEATSAAVTPGAKPAEPAPEPQPRPEPQPQPEPQPDCDDTVKPTTVLRKRGVQRGARTLTLSGSSSDQGGACPASGVRRVQVSVARVAGRTGVNCRFLRFDNRFALTRAQNCRRPVLFTAEGTDAWSFAFNVRLRPGKYRLQARAVDRSGNKETPKARRNIVLLTVR